MKTKMLNDNLLIKPDSVTTSAGGILIPTNANLPVRTGTVVAAGPDLYNEHTCGRRPMQVQVTDRVMYPENAIEVNVEGQVLALIQEGYILAIL